MKHEVHRWDTDFAYVAICWPCKARIIVPTGRYFRDAYTRDDFDAWIANHTNK